MNAPFRTDKEELSCPGNRPLPFKIQTDYLLVYKGLLHKFASKRAFVAAQARAVFHTFFLFSSAWGTTGFLRKGRNPFVPTGLSQITPVSTIPEAIVHSKD
jgi:hypothetical protein